MLIEESVRQGVPLLDALQETSHMRARDPEPETEERRPGPAPPDAGVMAQLREWNEMSK